MEGLDTSASQQAQRGGFAFHHIVKASKKHKDSIKTGHLWYKASLWKYWRENAQLLLSNVLMRVTVQILTWWKMP